MKKSALSIILFWAIFALLFAYAQDVLLPKNSTTKTWNLFNSLITPYTNAARSRAFEALPENTVDAAFIGSSIVFCGVNPVQLYRDYGIASHDYAVGAITNALTDYMCDLVFERESPRYVFLDATRLYADFLNSSSNYILPMTKLTASKIRLAVSTGDLTTATEYLIPLLSCHQNWTAVDRDDFAFSFAKNEDPLLGMIGMVNPAADAQTLYESFSRPAMEYADFTPDVKPVLTELSKKQVLAFRDKCVAHGAQPVLMVCPSVFGNECTQFLLQLEAFADDNGIPMMNFNLHRNGLTLEPEDFADDHHLTVTGMTKFTAVLGEYLKTNYDLPDRRGDAAYARYDESVAVYENALSQIATLKEETR